MAVGVKISEANSRYRYAGKAVGYGAAWEGRVSLEKTLNSVPEAPGSHYK